MARKGDDTDTLLPLLSQLLLLHYSLLDFASGLQTTTTAAQLARQRHLIVRHQFAAAEMTAADTIAV